MKGKKRERRNPNIDPPRLEKHHRHHYWHLQFQNLHCHSPMHPSAQVPPELNCNKIAFLSD